MPGTQLPTGDLLYYSKTQITSAQLLALKATPVLLIPVDIVVPPNPNVILIPLSISLHYLFLTAAYTLNAGTLRLYYGPVANAKPLCADQAALLTNVASEVNPNVAVSAVGVVTEAQGLNMPIYLGNAGAAEFTVGGGSLVVNVTYGILTI